MSIFLERIGRLRSAMKQHSLSAWYISGSDPHGSEYLPSHWNEREWITGFTGSSGKLVITQTSAAIWIDSRYFIQAENELADSGIILQKIGKADTPTIAEWILTEVKRGTTIGTNGLTINEWEYKQLSKQLAERTIFIDTSFDLLEEIGFLHKKEQNLGISILPDSITGESIASKMERMRLYLEEQNADYWMVSALDNIAWFLNARGNDIAYNPVFISYLVVTKSEANLFTDALLTTEQIAFFAENRIKTAPYATLQNYLQHRQAKKVLLADFKKTSHAIIEWVHSEIIIKDTISWIAAAKGIKNNIEIEGFKKAMVKDGIALTQYLMWLEEQMASESITEFDAEQKIIELHGAQPDYVKESFHPIIACNEHAALPHFHASESNTERIPKDSVVLTDCGAHYLHATTDLTRTIGPYNNSQEAKKVFTLVLKGLIALTKITFPKGSRGVHLDGFARQFLWKDLKDYGHGTGHGVGHFLNVHEGPHAIRKEDNGVALEAGMICSIEPAYYKKEAFGIRCENLVIVKEVENSNYLCFETLTLVPFDTHLIDKSLLVAPELDWINHYHKTIYDTLSPNLNIQEKAWLAKKCEAI